MKKKIIKKKKGKKVKSKKVVTTPKMPSTKDMKKLSKVDMKVAKMMKGMNKS